MRSAITNWQELCEPEQTALNNLLGAEQAIALFDQQLPQAGRDTLINMYYLLTSERVAGNLWKYIRALQWAQCNQIGIHVDDPEIIKEQLIASGNFHSDGRLTLYFKKSLWSLRQIEIDGQPIGDYGLQVYRPDNREQPGLLVVDIDTIVFSAFYTWPRHALDILRPDPTLNDPLRAREALISRGIFNV